MKSLRIGDATASAIALSFICTCFSSSLVAAQPLCVGDCNDDGNCSINELVTIVNVALDVLPLSRCEAGDANDDEQIAIEEAMHAVNNALLGCPRQVFAVTIFEDTNDGVCDSDCSLREAIIAANASERATVTLPDDFYGYPRPLSLDLDGAGEDAAATGDLDITGNLRILGPSTISGDATDRVFHIHPGATVSIAGVVIRSGSANEGGGIYNAGTLTLTDSAVSGNSAGVDGGGGIFNTGTLTLTDSAVSGNSAGVDGGGGIFNTGTLALTDSRVSDNSVEGFGGGGIFNDGTLTLTESMVSGNSATRHDGPTALGGGILNRSGRLTLINSTVSGNSAGAGGGIENHDENGAVTVIDSTLSGNVAMMGGGIYVEKGTLALTNSTVSGNSDGGIHSEAVTDVTLTNTTLSGNDGGGLVLFAAPVRLTNTVIAGNSGGNCSGGVLPTSGGHNLDDDGTCNLTELGDLSDVEANLAPLDDYGGPTETHALCTGPGAPDPLCNAESPAIDASDNASCPDTDQRGVERPVLPGGMCDMGAYEANMPLTVTETDDTNDGSCDADCSLREAIIAANALPGPDAVIVPAGSYVLALSGGDNDSAFGDLDITGDLSLTGAGAEITVIDGNEIDRVFEIRSANVRIADVTIQKGKSVDGGGVLNRGTLTMIDIHVTGNAANTGGGISHRGFDNWLRLTNCTISDNSAAVDGGGISHDSGSDDNGSAGVRLTNCAVTNNSAGGLGGGIYNRGVAFSLTDSLVSDNSAQLGGGMYFRGSGAVADSLVSRNVAEAGGGIFSYGELTLAKSAVTNNSAVRFGGGIENYSGAATLTNCTLSGNSAEFGGGIFNIKGSTLTLTNSTISGNSADAGGGIWNARGAATVTNATLANTIVADNLSGGSCAGDQPFASEGHNLDADGSCGLTADGDLSNVDAQLAPFGDYGGPTDTHGLCIGPGVPDASCVAASPALDAGGTALCPDTDQRGVERPQPPGGFCDIGAYEAQ